MIVDPTLLDEAFKLGVAAATPWIVWRLRKARRDINAAFRKIRSPDGGVALGPQQAPALVCACGQNAAHVQSDIGDAILAVLELEVRQLRAARRAFNAPQQPKAEDDQGDEGSGARAD